MNLFNLLVNCDSYKPSHWPQYPEGTTKVESGIEARRGRDIMYFGLQMFIKEYLLKPFTAEDVAEAKELLTAHGVPFNEAGWLLMLEKHGGYLPLQIDALPEGVVHNGGTIQVRVVNTDDEFPWLTSYVETALLRAVWYPSTVATLSFSIRKLIKSYLEETADNLSGLPFKLHDFGARGVSSFESAGIGGLAHLAAGSMGTDTLTALLFAKKYYNEKGMPAFSIAAGEHSTYTAWGNTDEDETAAYRNMIQVYGKPGAMFAMVCDARNVYNAVENIIGGTLRQQIIDSGATLIVRPDSGHPATVVLKVMQLLDMKFGHTVNEKGYRVLNHVRVIQGDGIVYNSIKEILEVLKAEQYSADNIAFGMGGGLLQHVNRDTYSYAMKAHAAEINGKWVEVFKDPVTDPGKRSKRGRQETMVSKDGKSFLTVPLEALDTFKFIDKDEEPCVPGLRTVFRNGTLLIDEDFQTIRDRAASFL